MWVQGTNLDSILSWVISESFLGVTGSLNNQNDWNGHGLPVINMHKSQNHNSPKISVFGANKLQAPIALVVLVLAAML